jgi:hypothetical protein
MYLGSVRDPFRPGHARAVSAAVEVTIRLHAVADDLHAAVLADGGEGVDRALEAVEGARTFPGHIYLEGLVVIVAADLALGHAHHPLPVPVRSILPYP